MKKEQVMNIVGGVLVAIVLIIIVVGICAMFQHEMNREPTDYKTVSREAGKLFAGVKKEFVEGMEEVNEGE